MLTRCLLYQDELKNELAELEQDELNERLAGAERAPTTALPTREERKPIYIPFLNAHLLLWPFLCIATRHRIAEEDDEEAQLKQLQAALAM